MKCHKLVYILLITVVFASLLVVGAGVSTRARAPEDNSRGAVLQLFNVDQKLEEAAYAKGSALSDQQLKTELQDLYDSWAVEEQWASFLQVLLLHQKSHDNASYMDWQRTWSELTGALWVQTNMYGERARELLVDPKFNRTKFLDMYSAMSVRIDMVHAQRIRLAEGVMKDVLDPGSVDLFLEPWPQD